MGDVVSLTHVCSWNAFLLLDGVIQTQYEDFCLISSCLVIFGSFLLEACFFSGRQWRGSESGGLRKWGRTRSSGGRGNWLGCIMYENHIFSIKRRKKYSETQLQGGIFCLGSAWVFGENARYGEVFLAIHTVLYFHLLL